MAKMRVTSKELAQFLSSKGVFSEETIRNFIAIAQLESRNSLNIKNIPENDGVDDSYGLFQVNFKPNADGHKRAKRLGIPTENRKITLERDGEQGSKFYGQFLDMPTSQGLKDWWGLTTDYTKEELLEKNLEALLVGMGYEEGDSYGAWSVHPDNVKNGNKPEYIKAWKAAFADANALNFTGKDLSNRQYEDMILKKKDELIRLENEIQELNLENNDIRSSYRGTRQFRGGEQIDRNTGLSGRFEDDETYIANSEQVDLLQKRLEQVSMEMRSQETFDPVFVNSTDNTEDEDYYPLEFGEPEPGMVEEREWDSVASRLKYLEGRDDLLVNGRDLFDIIQNDWEALGLEKGTEEFEAWVEEQLKQTDYYKDLTRNQKTALEQWQSAGPDSGEEEYSTRRRGLIAGQKRLLENVLNGSGIVWDETKILDAAKFFWENGINSESEIKQWLSDGDTTVEDVNFVDTEDTVLRGEINKSQENVANSARQYNISLDPMTLEKDSKRLFNGDISVTELNAEYADYAADLYPAWADRLQAGRTVLDIANSFSGIFANTIGRNPMWDGEDSQWLLGLGGGQIAPAGFAEALRRSDTYDTSTKGINAAYRQAAEIGTLLGANA